MGVQFLKLNSDNELVGVSLDDEAAPISSLHQTVFRSVTHKLKYLKYAEMF